MINLFFLIFFLFICSFFLFLSYFFFVFLSPAFKLFCVTWVNKLHLHLIFLHRQIRCFGMFWAIPVFRGVPGCSVVFRGVPGCLVFRGVPVFLVLVHALFISLITRMRYKRDIKMGRLYTPGGAVIGIVGGGVTFRFF